MGRLTDGDDLSMRDAAQGTAGWAAGEAQRVDVPEVKGTPSAPNAKRRRSKGCKRHHQRRQESLLGQDVGVASAGRDDPRRRPGAEARAAWRGWLMASVERAKERWQKLHDYSKGCYGGR